MTPSHRQRVRLNPPSSDSCSEQGFWTVPNTPGQAVMVVKMVVKDKGGARGSALGSRSRPRRSGSTSPRTTTASPSTSGTRCDRDRTGGPSRPPRLGPSPPSWSEPPSSSRQREASPSEVLPGGRKRHPDRRSIGMTPTRHTTAPPLEVGAGVLSRRRGACGQAQTSPTRRRAPKKRYFSAGPNEGAGQPGES